MSREASLEGRVELYLDYLCHTLPSRRTGTAGNREATSFFAETIGEFGFKVETPAFDCIEWESGQASLSVNNEPFSIQISPYSLGVDVNAPLVQIGSIDELASATLEGKVVLLSGELTKEQLMPKNFPFYNPEHHRQMIEMLEAKKPAALIAATGKDPQVAGGLYPFPLFEDGDFDIPSIYMTDTEGERLAAFNGQNATLKIEAERIPSIGYNVIARTPGGSNPRLVTCAHIDAKEGTPGAIDNAAGVATLLLLAERLRDYQGPRAVEIVALNGEDYYAASGEILYTENHLDRPEDILLAINIDGAGYKHGNSAYSIYGCSADLENTIKAIFSNTSGLTEGPQWYQSDHSIFIQKNVPAVAITSDQFDHLWSQIAHTPADHPGIVAASKLVELSAALLDLIEELAQ